MRFRPLRLRFRTKVVLLAILLVLIQLGTVFPLLLSIRVEQKTSAEQQAVLAGSAFAEYMQNRTNRLTGFAEIVGKDFNLIEAMKNANPLEIADMLGNLAKRAEFAHAALFDFDGGLIGGLGSAAALQSSSIRGHFVSDPGTTEAYHSIVFVADQPYQAVSVPIREVISLYEASAWLTLAYPIDEQFAHDVRTLTGHETTFVRFGLGRTDHYATTLADESSTAAFAGVHLGDSGNDTGAVWERDYISLLRPVLSEDDDLYVALQLPVVEAMSSYVTLRNVLLIVTGMALLATVGAAFWLSRMVTSPIGRLVDAAKRMADGIYNQPIAVQSSDEFGVLAQGFNAMQQAIATREQDIVHMAHHDSLSGLPTREIVVGEIRDAIAQSHQMAIINFVLHRFDEFASSLGHRTADRLIQLVAGRMRDQLEEEQILGHLNHQEFVLVLPGASLADAEDYVVSLQSMLRSGVSVDGANISLQVRAGVALYPSHGVNASELLRCAAIARGQANHHLGSVGVYEPGQEEKSLQLIQIVGDFPRALQNRELWVEYQPQIDCQSLELNGAEALVRWEHPTLGRLAPDIFIEAIEQAGGISQLTRWVLDEAIATLASWRSRGVSIAVSVNISANDLIDDYLPKYLKNLCQRFAIEPQCLTLEVTESAIMLDVEHSLAIVAELRGLGCKVAIDDFGTGHSALAQLKRLPVDELKIDKSFVLNMGDARDEAVVRTAVELAHKFGLHAVAEGVEDEASLLRLQQLGCETAQGFFFSKALKPDDFLAWARAWDRGEGADIVTLVASSTGIHRA